MEEKEMETEEEEVMKIIPQKMMMMKMKKKMRHFGLDLESVGEVGEHIIISKTRVI